MPGRQARPQLVLWMQHYLTVTHEILHAAGVYHEQSRPDRDEYVKIHWDNIQKGAETNFKKMNYYAVMDDTPYDYRSIIIMVEGTLESIISQRSQGSIQINRLEE